MEKILIADNSPQQCQALEAALGGIYRVVTCNDGEQTLELLHTYRPDGLVLDLLLPGMDGLGVLQAAFSAGVCPPSILVTGTYFSGYVSDALMNMGVNYLMLKPCSASAVATRMVDMECASVSTVSTAGDAKADRLLFRLGLRTDLRGYICVRAGLLRMMDNPAQSVTKELYPAVARACNGTSMAVERAIRNVIHDAWLRRDRAAWNLYFSADECGKEICPTNGMFLSRLAASMEQAPMLKRA